MGLSESNALSDYGTGLRHASPNSSTASIGGVAATILYLGAQPQDPGLDQVNLLVPHSLVGAGEVPVRISVGGASANVVTLSLQ